MINNKKRPINLDLATIKFPIMAIVSILHRISGVVLFLFLPLVLYGFNLSVMNARSFAKVQIWLTYSCSKLMIWLFASALLYHLFAGMRHMIMDFGTAQLQGCGGTSPAASPSS